MTQSAQKLAQFKQVLENATARRTRIQITLESARQQYHAAAAEALAEHGTDSLPALKEKLQALEVSNEKATVEFCEAVAAFERHIAELETALASPEALAQYLTARPALDTSFLLEPLSTPPGTVTHDGEDI